jgi:hypothetical protein
MSTPLQNKMINDSSFDYWLHNGTERGKGELQRVIEKLPAITKTILEGGDWTLADQTIIHTAIFAGDDLEIMSQNWPKRIAVLRANLTDAQVMQIERNKSSVLALNAQVTQLLLALQNACNSHNYPWAVAKQDVIRNVIQSYKGARKRDMEKEKRSVGHLPDAAEGTWPEFVDDRHLTHMSGMLSRLNNLSKS